MRNEVKHLRSRRIPIVLPNPAQGHTQCACVGELPEALKYSGLKISRTMNPDDKKPHSAASWRGFGVGQPVSFRFGIPPIEGRRWVGIRPGQRAELVEVSKKPAVFPPPARLFRADHTRGEGVATGLAALLMHDEGVRPEQAEIWRVPERILPRLRRSPGI